jgi:hypothetical protein
VAPLLPHPCPSPGGRGGVVEQTIVNSLISYQPSLSPRERVGVREVFRESAGGITI